MAFPYAPLQSSRQEIRLITLHPSESDCTPLQLHLETATLDNAGGYTCLSYTWGSPAPTRSVEIDGYPFGVGENLYSALERLRLPDKPRRLWADAICINQGDIPEREAQVSIMHHIYATATDVIAWIGKDNGAPDRRAIDFIRELGARGRSYMEAAVDRRGSDAPLDEETVAWFESITPFGLVDSIWLDFTALLERPWFSRIWIVQEVVMGKKVTVQCGPHQFEWVELFYCSTFVHEHASLLKALAAPGCIKEHDPKSAEFFSNSLPLHRLSRAIFSIRSIGYLSSSQWMQRCVRDLTEPDIGERLAALSITADANQSLSHWGVLSLDSGSLIIHSTEPAVPPSLLSNPSFVRRHLEPQITDRETLGDLIAVLDPNIPIYSTIPNDRKGANKAAESSSDSTKRWSLYTLVSRFRAFDSTDPRDKVYALLGIASQVKHISPLPTISYHPDTRMFDVMCDVIDATLTERPELAFLEDACWVGGGGAEGFPSWMPLWYDAVSHLPSTPAPFGELKVEGLVKYAASGGCCPRWVRLDRARRELGVGGVVAGRVEVLGEVFDRDRPESEQRMVWRRWAGMLGLGEVEKLRQVLMALKLLRVISDEKADARLQHALDQLPATQGELYRRFVGTILASSSDKATTVLSHPPAEAKSAVMAKMLSTGKRGCHYFHAEKQHGDSRGITVCHGRRLFICTTGDSPEDWNFGLCPENAREGDRVALLVGSNVLHIIREPDADDSTPDFFVRLVGEAYVHNWMDGQLLGRTELPGLPGVRRLTAIKLR